MVRNVAEPRDAGGFEGDRGVEAAGDGAVDDGLLLLVEQRDHLPLRPDRPLQPPVRPVQKPHNRRLLVRRGERDSYPLDRPVRQPVPSDSICLDMELRGDEVAFERPMKKTPK